MLVMVCGYFLAVTAILALFRASARADAMLDEMYAAEAGEVSTPHAARPDAFRARDADDAYLPAGDRPEAFWSA